MIVNHKRGPVVAAQDYYPFGLEIAGLSTQAIGFGGNENRYKYNGKELQSQEFSDGSGLELYDFGFRMHDPQIGRWTTIDPLAHKRYWATPYNYVQNNPMNRYDPNGLTDYTLNKKTGEIKEVAGTKDDGPDRIVKSKVNKSGEAVVKYKNNGKAKVAIDGIEKGILKDGQNFQNKDQVISVGGKGQPSVDGVKSFTLQLSEHIGKEIKGFSYSADGSKNVTDMVLGKYINNKVDESFGSPNELSIKYGDKFSLKNILQQFHTHPDGKLGATESDPNLSTDVTRLQGDKPQIPNASFIILYRIAGKVQPEEYDYTDKYIPKKNENMMKKLITAFIVIVVSASSLYSQNKTIKGRVISDFFETMAIASIMINDTVEVGRTDLNGSFQINIPVSVEKILFRGVGLESAIIELADTCDEVEIVMLLSSSYDFMTLKKVDRLRMKRFKKLPALHKQAFEKGIFKNDKACYTQTFLPHYKKKQK